MKIRERLVLGFIGTFLLLGFVSYTCKTTNSEIRRSALIVNENLKQEVKGTSDMLLALQATQTSMRRLLETQNITASAQNKSVYSKNINKQIEVIENYLSQLEKTLLFSKYTIFIEIDNYKHTRNVEKEKKWQEKLEYLSKLEKEISLYKQYVNIFLETYNKNTLKAYLYLEKTIEKQYEEKLLHPLNDYKNGKYQELVIQSNKIIEVANAAEHRIIIATIVSLISAIFTGSLIARTIFKPLNQLKEIAETIGKGGMSTRFKINSRDEVAILGNAFNQMLDDLSKTTVAKSYVDKIINSMTDTLMVINSNATIIRINNATIKLLGYAEHELIGRQMNQVLTPEFYQILEKNTIIRGAIANTETVYITKEGRQIPVSFSASVMLDDHQKIQGIVCVAHDITERKEAAKLNTLLVTAIQNAADAIEITDAQAKFEYVNPAFEKVTGYKSSEVIGKTPANLLRSGKHDAAFYQQISNTLASSQVWIGNYIGKRKNGTLYHQEVTISPVSNAAGLITHHVAVKRDITERKQVEEALRESQANLSALIENTQDAVWSVDTEYKVITLNTNFQQQFLLAYGTELKIGMNIVECLSPEIRDVWVEYYNHALAGKRFCFEQHYEFATSLDIEFSFNPIFTSDGKVIGVSAFGRNITEHKRAQEQLKKINECFLSFKTDPVENINRLTALFGELLGSAYTLYNRLEDEMLYCIGQCQIPIGYNMQAKPEEYICYDVIQQGSDEVFVLHDLAQTKYAQTDPNIIAYKLQTYVGKAVKCRESVIGSLCAVYQTNYIPTTIDLKVIGIIAAAIGVEEERRITQESLRESEERYALAVLAANDGLWDWNLKTNKVYFSPRSKALLGCLEAEIGDDWSEFFKQVHPEDINSLKSAIAAHLEGATNHFESEYRVLHQDGQYRWILCRGLAVRDSSGKPYRMAGSQTDITQRKLAESQLLHQAFHDGLTGLPNRLLFIERLEYALGRSQRVEGYLFAVLFIDLDRFKVVNDSLGHNIGDQLLVAIAQRLKACVRQGDTVARLGGDEFTVLLSDILDVSDANSIADRILQSLSMPFHLSGHEVFTTASIGIAISHSGYKQAEDLLRDADTVMYRAKKLGKARYEIFDPTLHNQAMARLQLEIDLRRALERQELQVYYQPIVSLNNEKITGFEALVRWQHPQLGFISPAEFIPVAEETGLIIPLDLWVLRQACKQIRTWQQQFPLTPLTISVNMSGKQLAQPDIVQKIQQILQETSFDARSLKLEITESVLVENAAAATAILKQLKDLGIGLSIDDFGTGYSSLSYLHRLPIDTLKIDRSFVNDVDCDPEKIEIIRTVVGLAWNLSMDIVAEGVETKKQMYQLQALRCEYGQGYLFSKPVDSQKAQRLLSEQWICDKDLWLAIT